MSLVRNLSEVMCEGWLTEEHLRHDCGVIAGWLRMTLDEGVGYLGGQRLAHERPYLLGPALDTYANASWHAMRRSRFERGEYRQGFMAGFQDELAGLAHPLPSE